MAQSTIVPPTQVIHSIEQHALGGGFPIVLDLEKSRGSLLVDAVNGDEYLDFYTFFASLPLGFNHPGLSDERTTRALAVAAQTKAANGDMPTPLFAQFVDTLERVAIPRSYPHYFFIEGGALAVENTMKAAFDWKYHKNRAQNRTAQGSQILHFEHAFHGRTGYTMSCTNTEPNKVAHFPKFAWPRIESPAVQFPLSEDNLALVQDAEVKALTAVERAFDKNPDDIAAILIEPIQSEGGDRHFRSSFLKGLRRIADEREALLIFDEVQTGMGVTGKWWGFQNFGVELDLFAASKKLQVGAVFASRRMDEVPENVFARPGRISSTWTGNLVDMVRATRVVEIIEQDHLVENARDCGEALRAGLEQLCEKYPNWLSNPRGCGLLCAVDLPDTKARDCVVERCRLEKMLVLTCGPKSLRFRPALNVPKELIHEGLNRLERALLTEFKHTLS